MNLDDLDLRLDPLSGMPVVVTSNRSNRPYLPTSACPFCPGGTEVPREFSGPIWFPNRWPALPDDRCEVIVYSSQHRIDLPSLGVGALEDTIHVWCERSALLGRRDDVEYVLIFENAGSSVGATIEHPHCQLYALPLVPPRVQFEIEAMTASCLLCEEPPAELVVAESSSWRAWVPHATGWPYGLRIAPVRHLGALSSLADDDVREFAAIWHRVLVAAASVLGGAEPRLMWIHQEPTGANSPSTHLHMEMIFTHRAPGVPRIVGAGEVASGVYLNPVDPAVAARRLREAMK